MRPSARSEKGDPATFVTFGLRQPFPRRSLNQRHRSALRGLLRQDGQDFRVCLQNENFGPLWAARVVQPAPPSCPFYVALLAARRYRNSGLRVNGHRALEPLDAGGSGPYNAAVLAPPRLAHPSSRAIRLRGLRLFGLTLILSCLLSAVSPASEVYFSPNGGVRQRLVRAIQDSRKTIDIAVYNFTAYELADALYAAKARGVSIRVLVDREMAETGGSGVRGLRLNGIPVRSLGVPEQSLMHHKFAVFDERLVVTGSYNWTNSAERANYENLVVLEDPALVTRFQQEFGRLWSEAKE